MLALFCWGRNRNNSTAEKLARKLEIRSTSHCKFAVPKPFLIVLFLFFRKTKQRKPKGRLFSSAHMLRGHSVSIHAFYFDLFLACLCTFVSVLLVSVLFLLFCIFSPLGYIPKVWISTTMDLHIDRWVTHCAYSTYRRILPTAPFRRVVQRSDLVFLCNSFFFFVFSRILFLTSQCRTWGALEASEINPKRANPAPSRNHLTDGHLEILFDILYLHKPKRG